MAGPSNKHGLFALENIPVTDSFFLGADATGAFKFRTDVMERGGGLHTEKTHCVEGPQLIAMGLTEVCSEIGKGKVGRTSKRVYNATLRESSRLLRCSIFPCPGRLWTGSRWHCRSGKRMRVSTIDSRSSFTYLSPGVTRIGKYGVK